ncbi:hypothetical protein DITRI_Ditri14bG0106100 [Diplodiscus trichospermus]
MNCVGKFEVGRTVGERTFAKVMFARNSKIGELVALKIIDKGKVLKHKIAEQIKREIATMKLTKHANVVRSFFSLCAQTRGLKHGGAIVISSCAAVASIVTGVLAGMVELGERSIDFDLLVSEYNSEYLKIRLSYGGFAFFSILFDNVIALLCI